MMNLHVHCVYEVVPTSLTVQLHQLFLQLRWLKWRRTLQKWRLLKSSGCSFLLGFISDLHPVSSELFNFALEILTDTYNYGILFIFFQFEIVGAYYSVQLDFLVDFWVLLKIC